jgi:hypothetical protein
MNNNTDVLRVEENGIELFTIVATGESGMSQRGLARACGKSHTAIQKLEKTVATAEPPKRLKRFIGKQLRLATGLPGSPIVYRADFCSAVIKHYAYLGSETAQDIDEATGEIGLNSYIQAKTGWLPNEYQSSQESRNILDLLILAHAEKRSIHFDEEWQKEACRVTTYQWDGMPMAKFIRRSVYDLFPRALVKKLEDVNPYANSKRRENKHYQHFEKNLDENVLKQHIRDVLNILKLATSLKHFWQLMSDRFGDGIQLDLDL